MSLGVFGLSGVFGATFIATDWLRLGLRMQTPLIKLRGNANTFQVSHAVDAGAITTQSEDKIGTDAAYQLPFDFTFGTALVPVNWFALLVDISLQLGTTYDSIPDSLLNEEVSLKPHSPLQCRSRVSPGTLAAAARGLLPQSFGQPGT